MEPYEDLMAYDDPLLDEIREVVTRPHSSVVLPAAAGIGRPMQRTVKASGRLYQPEPHNIGERA